MPKYDIQQLFNIVYGLLKGNKSCPSRERTCTKIFLCEYCSGRGYFSESKSNEFGEDCEVCKGEGRIKLEFSVKQVNLNTKEK